MEKERAVGMRYNGNFEGIDFEWTEHTFGYLSIPIFVLGIIVFSFPDMLYKWFLEIRYRGLKSNGDFEDNLEKREIPMIIERILKKIGLIMIALGMVWFWFSKEVYELLF